MPKLTWKTIQVQLGNLKEWQKNPAQISERDAKQLARSLDKFGYIIPFVAAAPPSGNGKKELPLLDGHQRKAVELSLRHTDPKTMVDVRVPNRALTEKEKQEAVIRMRSNTGEYNPDALLNWFDGADLLDWGMPLKELEGFGFEFTDGSADAEPEIDRAAELLKKWKVKTGDLWQIGEHRLICGDCTDAAVVARVMEGERASLVITSPPYFNQREYSQWESYEDYLSFVCLVVDNLPMNKDCIVGVNIGSDEQARHWMPSDWWCILRDAGYLYRECISWVKAAAVWSVPRSMHINKGHYFPALRWEVIMVASKGKHPAFEMEDVQNVRKFDENVWNIGVVTGGEQKALGHNAPFPVEIPERFTMAYTTKEKIVYEPFCGSGTTLVACQNLNRRGRAIEISPAYCAVTLERMAQAFPGIEIKRVK